MTKTCPHCQATALSTSQRERMGITDSMIEAGARVHNPFAFDIAGTPMPVHRAQSRNEARKEVRAILSAALAAAPAVDATQGAFECMGRKQSLPEPGECNWPDCGCDPHATKVIESLLEQGWTGPAVTSTERRGQSMDEAAADNFGLTADDLDEGDDE